MKKSLFILFFFLTTNSFSQKVYSGFNLGYFHSKYYQNSFDKMKPFLSDSLKLATQFEQNINSKGLGIGLFKGKEAKYEFSFNINLLYKIDQKKDLSGVKCFLNQTNTNLSTLAGVYLTKWLRIDAGITYTKIKLRLKKGNDFYGLNEKIESNIFSLHTALPIVFWDKKHKNGFSIGPYCDLGFTRFNHTFPLASNYNGSNKSSLTTIGIEAKFSFQTSN